MQRVIISMQNFVLGEAVEQALVNGGDFHVTVAETPEQAGKLSVSLAANSLLMEVTGYTPYKLDERLKIRDEVRRLNPLCKIILMVDEKTEKEAAEKIRQAKKDGLIDQFIYGSTSASYLVAQMDAL